MGKERRNISKKRNCESRRRIQKGKKMNLDASRIYFGRWEFLIKRKWKKWVRGRRGGNQAIVAECEGKGCGEGDRANTPHISQLKTKPAPACCLVNARPGQRPDHGAASHLILTHSNTQEPGNPLRLGPGVHSSTSDSPRRAHSCTHTHTHTHLEPVNATVIQRQWGLKRIAHGRHILKGL